MPEAIVLAVVLDVSVRMAILAVSMAVVIKVFRVETPRFRHQLWLGVLITMLMMPLLRTLAPPLMVPIPSLSLLGQTPLPIAVQPTPDAAGLVDAGLTTSTVSSLTPTAASGPTRVTWLALGWTLYLAGFALLALRLARGWQISRRLWASSRPVPDTVTSSGTTIFESASVTSPVTLGVWRPRILLPVTWRRWSPNQLAAVLAHEEAHVVRRDSIVSLLAGINRTIFWFHPVAWWLERELALRAEEACDEAGIAALGGREGYAAFLVSLARNVQRQGGLLVTHVSGMADRWFLSHRIDRILSGRITLGVSRSQVLGAITTGTVMVLLVVLVEGRASASSSELPPGRLVSVPAPATAPAPPSPLFVPVPSPQTETRAANSPNGIGLVNRMPAAPSGPVDTPSAPILSASPVFAQSPTNIGLLVGVVTDATGGRMPGVTVVATSTTRSGVEYRLRSAASGFFQVEIAPDSYDVQFSMPGFRTLHRSNVSVIAGLKTLIEPVLELGSLSEAVTVSNNGAVDTQLVPLLPARPLPPSSSVSNPFAYFDLARAAASESRIEEAEELIARGLQELEVARAARGASNSTAAIRIGGDVKPPTKVRHVPPMFPAGGASGVVILDATIGEDGRVRNVGVLRGLPDLAAAAQVAVQQWIYVPTFLSGVPMPVTATITVNFVAQ